jgi:hypothetical protein
LKSINYCFSLIYSLLSAATAAKTKYIRKERSGLGAL